ncbi:MAG TPA: VWA domain-containing protein [Solirubrobacteraceae bacterium]|nr:VWA domain-containing protein [Solirubrobacteraceae bacterium]
MTAFEVETVQLDLPALAGAFGRRLHEAGVPVTAERSANFAAALSIVRPVARRRLYWTARAVFVSDPSQVRAFNRVFTSVFGTGDPGQAVVPPDAETAPAPPDHRETEERPPDASRPPRTTPHPPHAGTSAPAGSDRGRDEERDERTIEVPMLASDEEVLRDKRFDALDADELAALYALMARLRVATPLRRTRRARRDAHGERIDLRRTLRASLRTGGDPVRLARRRRRQLRRRMVLLCDISGSMEPYARTYLQFLTCAAAGGVSTGRSASRPEAFAFATRLTRLTRALQSRSPERAIQRAAAAAPDWASGTHIGDALKTFNDRYGRRGMARGAVVVILSDGWERGDPHLVAREMQRLARLAYRIVWVNPRTAARDFAPRTGGMAAALPHCDALVSGHTLAALHEVIDAIGADRARDADPATTWVPPAPAQDQATLEPWGSATPVPGSSVAMPSGYSPSRGRTTSDWNAPRPFGPVHELPPKRPQR